MQILFVATNLPVPPNNGHAIRSLSIIQGLQAIGHELSFISFSKKDCPDDLYPLSAYCQSIDLLKLDMKNLTEQTDYVQRLKCLLALTSYSIERFRSQAMRVKIQEKLNGRKYDLIICDGLYALINIPETTIPIVLNCHNVEHIILKRYAELETNLLKKWYAKIESYLIRGVERNSCERIAIAMACSQPDLELLRPLRSDLVAFVVPNVVDTDSIRPSKNLPLDNAAPVLLFQGVMDWHPNRDAVEYFVREILSRIREQCPNVRFIVAGRNPPVEFVKRLSLETQIEFTGTVPDMRPYIAAANVVVVPLRVGGGTRIKILEACSAGRPVVSTTIGAEGLNLEAGKEIILADEPLEFARSVITLLHDSILSESIAKSARSAVVERYSHLTLEKILRSLTNTFTLRR